MSFCLETNLTKWFGEAKRTKNSRAKVRFTFGMGLPPAIWKLSLPIPLRGLSLNLPLLGRTLIITKWLSFKTVLKWSLVIF
ncbi:hypothetical protein AWR41_03455 [Riemerella anatipestifer]|nr:hypothetical protein [Riemerella anatipestifer]MSN94553.1 hypothetical protein [Riemerella anatipestifer]OBP43168.1 hypothetical protein AWR41_03455 [Riemerella anatipestifer]OBP65112.1 hypothetical protein AWB84_01065 [Riemerella anatipestifer]